MRSIQKAFEQVAKKHPDWPSNICFSVAIDGRNFSDKLVKVWFNKLVDKEEYAQSDKKQIISFMQGHTKRPEAGIK